MTNDDRKYYFSSVPPTLLIRSQKALQEMENRNLTARTASVQTISSRVRRARQTAFGLLTTTAALIASVAHAGDLPGGWAVRAENNGATFAPVKMNSGEQLEIWVAGSLYEVPQGASPQSQLPRIRQQAGAMAGDKCQPPEAASGVATQDCMVGNSALQYMLLPSSPGSNKMQLLCIRAAGSDEALERYSDGFQQTMKIVLEGRATAVLRDEGNIQEKAEDPAQKTDPENNLELPDGWQVRRENDGATFSPINVNPGEELELWVGFQSYDIERGANWASELLRIRKLAEEMEGDKCQPPQTVPGLATQQCEAGDSVLQYMIMSTSTFERLLRVRASGDGVLARYKDGLRRVIEIVSQNNHRLVLERQEKLESERIARAIRTTPGQGVRDGDVAAVFVTGQKDEDGLYRHTSWLLLKDGTGYQNTIPPDELNVKVSRQMEPKRWVQWRKPLSGNDYEIRGQDDKDWRRPEGWLAQPARSSERLNGAYEHVDYWGSAASFLTVEKTTWYFNGDGTFKISFDGHSGTAWTTFSAVTETHSDSTGSESTTSSFNTSGTEAVKAGNATGTDTGTVVTQSKDDGASRRGRYRLKGWVLEVDRDDGQTNRYFVTFPDDKRNQIDISSEWFNIKRE